ncbi:expressed unknown protein [Seminavis robusta]|uniref:Serine aminopeptidase S33 domain-containing protein n=1 Tax=Seminavis robusta TaxID=568900 RepID=A0A9N8DM21_9STRA|nr:expressed unknown protein [Seminavis robusta]|eukprot:Sro156_g070700.1 n/a (316) ;mRNA; f:23991-25018
MGAFRYFWYYVLAGFGFIYPQIIDKNDPYEWAGIYGVRSFTEEIPFNYNGKHETLQAELFEPASLDPEAFVLFMPGFGASYTGYIDYLEHLASHGFLAMGMDFAGTTLTIDGEHDVKAYQALDAIAYIRVVYPEYYDLPIYTAGHSLGGKIAFYAASLNEKIDGVMALDPVNAGGPPCAIFPKQCIAYPVAPNNETEQEGIMKQITEGTSSIIFRSKPDPLTNPDAQFNAANFYFGLDGQGLNAAPSPVWYYDMGEFPHGLYLSSLPSKQVQIIKRTMVAFLEQEVLGEDSGAYLTGSIIQADINDGYLVSVENR